MRAGRNYFILAVLLLFPALGWGQCMTIHTEQNTFGTVMQIAKVFSGRVNSVMCNVAMQSNAYCYPQNAGFVAGSTVFMCPPGTAYCAGFTATHSSGVPTQAGTPVQCVFSCTGCGMATGGPGAVLFTIDGSDGLPVELLDFSIEPEE